MTHRTYWLDLFTGKTWEEFHEAGGEVSGFRESRWKTVQQIRPGDIFLCYLTGVSRWIGALEVVSEPFRDDTRIWKDEDFPCRVKVKVVSKLTPATAVPVLELRADLSLFQNLKSPFAWTGHFRGSPAKWKVSDAEVVLRAIQEAERNPIDRPVDMAKLGRRPRALRTKIGEVTVPEGEQPADDLVSPAPDTNAHTEIQWLLLKTGNDMGLDVWAARNDRNLSYGGHKFAALAHMKWELPLQFDEATNRTIEHIDVLWLRGNAIVAAFEIESTTSIYSGLLRMSDLIAMQPNLNIPLYLVAPDERRDRVITEVNRPTFSILSPPMNQMCRFIPFSALRERLKQHAQVIRYLKPDFLEELSESCSLEAV